MKWAVYAPGMVHSILYFTFCADARLGVRILFGRLGACCYSKSGDYIESASGRVLYDFRIYKKYLWFSSQTKHKWKEPNS